MKKILTIVLSCVILNVCASVKPRNPIFRVVQTDGTELTVHHVGNGDFSAYQTVDGYCVALGSNGDYRYVERVEVDGSFVLASALAHNPSDRSTDEVRSVSSYVKTSYNFNNSSEFVGSFSFVVATYSVLVSTQSHYVTRTLSFNFGSIWQQKNGIELRFVTPLFEYLD